MAHTTRFGRSLGRRRLAESGLGTGMALGRAGPLPTARAAPEHSFRSRPLRLAPGGTPLPGTSARRSQRFRGGPLAGGHGLAGRKWAAAVPAERRRGRHLAELEGAGERSSGGPRGPSERTSGGPAAAAPAPGERGGDGAPSRAGAGASAMFAGLQDLGVANGEDLKETLTNCTEPLKAIEQFQVGPGGEAGGLGVSPAGGEGRVGGGQTSVLRMEEADALSWFPADGPLVGFRGLQL